MSLAFIGDVYEKTLDYYELVDNIDCPTIQVGNIGIGAVTLQERMGHWFIHGNNDDPLLCKQYKQFLGRYGVIELGGYNIWFASGAYTQKRTPGIWKTEQLTMREIEEAISLYNAPDIVVTHDCPISVAHIVLGKSVTPNLTNCAIDIILKQPKRPAMWIFGHHHLSRQVSHLGIDFVGLNELEIYRIGD